MIRFSVTRNKARLKSAHVTFRLRGKPKTEKAIMKKTSPIKFYAWVSLGCAADYLQVSEDTIARRAIPWPRDNQQVPGRIRYKLLDLGGEKRPRRYTMEDLRAMKEKVKKDLTGGKN